MMENVIFRQHLRCGGGRRSFIIVGMGGRAVEGSGLENRRACKRTVGSNPTPSAISSHTALIQRPVRVRMRPGRRLPAHSVTFGNNHSCSSATQRKNNFG